MVGTLLTAIPVPANTEVEYFAGSVSGTFRARISTTVTGGTVTVLAVRRQEQKGWSRRLWAAKKATCVTWLEALQEHPGLSPETRRTSPVCCRSRCGRRCERHLGLHRILRPL